MLHQLRLNFLLDIILQLSIRKLKIAKEKLSQSFQRRKDIVVQMDGNLYIEEMIEDICPKINLDEAHEEMKDLLQKNFNLQEEIRKLKREQ